MPIKKQIRLSFGFSTVGLIILILVIVGAGIGGFFYWSSPEPVPEPGPGPGPEPGPGPIPIVLTEATLAKRMIEPDDIVLAKVDVTPKIPQYNLPLTTQALSNYQEFSQKVQLSDNALSLLEKNGFVVIPTPKELGKSPDRFSYFYSALKQKDIPIFITTDSLLHYYHIFFTFVKFHFI